ncbi:MAG: hypothetical protein PHG25_00900 [Candidatus Pacebacteria bacterium]|nr:hypothetical protein [Candidatus Paceibacterota bacterium]
MKIAFIPPKKRSEYLTNTVLDGLLWLKRDGDGPASGIELALPPEEYLCPYDLSPYILNEAEFDAFARSAHLIILPFGKNTTNYELAEKIGRWDKTVFVDGGELGKDRRYDTTIRAQVEEMTYDGFGKIYADMLSKCALYFRREKPYIKGIIPLPFGIESRYLVQFDPTKKRNIDFCCIFGQDEYPILRRHATKVLEKFCKKNGFICQTKKTKGFTFEDDQKVAGRDPFYEILSRSKVGISIGGGGFDTARFWEILGNDCMLLTETIDIYEKDSTALNYKGIIQFKDLVDFEEKLVQVAGFLKNGYNQTDRSGEYAEIIKMHSSKARAMTVLTEAEKKGIISLN